MKNTILLILVILVIGMGSVLGKSITFSKEELQKLTEFYVSEDESAQVAYWKTLFPKQNNNVDNVIKNLPSEWKDKQIRDIRIETQILDIIKPLTALYNKTYKVIVLDFRQPFIMIDSDVVLIVTTELIVQMESEDQLLGVVAHEIAHSIFSEKTSIVKTYLKDKQNKESARKTLATVELSCDAIAIRTLNVLHKDSVAFLRLGVELEKRYEVDESDESYHPESGIRLQFGRTLSNGFQHKLSMSSHTFNELRSSLFLTAQRN